MVVQIDIDGTIDQAPEFFAWLTRSLRRDGHTILIVSSRTTSPGNLKFSAAEIQAFGVVYDKLLLSPAVEDLEPERLPPGLQPAHKIFLQGVRGAGSWD